MPCYSSPPREFPEKAESLNANLQKFRLLQQARHIKFVPVRVLFIVILDLSINAALSPAPRVAQSQYPVDQQRRIKSIPIRNQQHTIIDIPQVDQPVSTGDLHTQGGNPLDRNILRLQPVDQVLLEFPEIEPF